jgi:hypothetical protein
MEQTNGEKAARLAAIRAANAARRAAPDPAVDNTQAALPATESFADQAPAVAPRALVSLLLGAAAGALAAAVALPAWAPALSTSLAGTEPKAYWYLARSSALVAYGLIWLAMVFGLLMTSKLARLWPGGPTAFDLHQHTSLLGLAFALFHALILLGDRYIQATFAQVLVPFAYPGPGPLWVGLGQLALYGLALVALSFYVKDRLGRRTWRLIHFMSFALFALALAHGVGAGTDSGTGLARLLYWASGGSILFLAIYRAGAARGRKTRGPARPNTPAAIK